MSRRLGGWLALAIGADGDDGGELLPTSPLDQPADTHVDALHMSALYEPKSVQRIRPLFFSPPLQKNPTLAQ